MVDLYWQTEPGKEPYPHDFPELLMRRFSIADRAEAWDLSVVLVRAAHEDGWLLIASLLEEASAAREAYAQASNSPSDARRKALRDARQSLSTAIQTAMAAMGGGSQ